MSTTAQRVFAWSGIVFANVFFIGMLLAGILPPHSPLDNPSDVVNNWNDNVDLERLGIFLMMIAAGFTAPFGAVISVYLRKISPDGGYSYLQLIGAATGVVAILVPTFMFAAEAFRPDRPAEIQQAINDLAWIPFVMNYPPALMQTMAVGFATLEQKGENPLFPRWFGYYNLWTGFLFLPGGLILWFKHGAFAWNGALAFWLVAVAFGAWFIVTCLILLRAIKRTAAEEAAAAAPAAAPATATASA